MVLFQEERIEMHADAGHFYVNVGSGCELTDRDRDRAAEIALAEGHDGSGNPLVNLDGSRALHPHMDPLHVEVFVRQTPLEYLNETENFYELHQHST